LVDVLKKAADERGRFAKASYLGIPRVFFSLLVHGTSEGRLACRGTRKGLDPNIHQQPKEIRKIFAPDYRDWGFLSLDLKQAENMITALLAEDHERIERLATPGFDEHAFMAGAFFNKPWEECKKGGRFEHLRKPGKVINHGRNYGLGVRKTQENILLEGFQTTESDCREMIEIWKRINRRTAEWQTETIALVRQQSFLENPFGRKRWFQSRDYATKALAFLPASTVADMVLRMMIAMYQGEFWDEITALGISVAGVMPEKWDLRIQVHDELVAQGPAVNWQETAAFMKEVMTQPWRELGGFALGVDVGWSGTGGSWGDCKEVRI